MLIVSLDRDLGSSRLLSFSSTLATVGGSQYPMPNGSLRSRSCALYRPDERDDGVWETLNRLININVTVDYISPRTGRQCTIQTRLLDFFHTDDDDAGNPTVRYRVPQEFSLVLARSNHWDFID
jgi:hypothetical protein